MLDEKLSCLLEESEDDCTIKSNYTNKNQLHGSNKKSCGENCQRSTSSILNFNIQNIRNLDTFLKNSYKNRKTNQYDEITDKIINTNTPFYDVKTKKEDKSKSGQFPKINSIFENEHNILSDEFTYKNAQLKLYSPCKYNNRKKTKYEEAHKKCTHDESCTYFSKKQKKKEENCLYSQSTDYQNLFNNLNHFHNDQLNPKCKLNKNHDELENKKMDKCELQENDFFYNEADHLKNNKEEPVNNTIYKRNKILETNLYKERPKIDELTKECDQLKDKGLLDDSALHSEYKSFDNDYTDVQDNNSSLINSNNNNSFFIDNNEIRKQSSRSYPHYSFNELSIVSMSLNSFSSNEFIENRKYKRSVTILNSNSSTYNSLLGPAGLKEKIKKHNNKKNEEYIYCFSFIKYKAWIKTLQILNLPLDPFHLGINSHKYINTTPTIDSSFLYKHNIHKILNNKKFSNYRIKIMIVIIKSVICRNHGYLLVVMDPSGQMPASLHKEVENEYKKNIQVGCALLLKDVTVFDTIDNFPYLIITLRSLVRVIKSEETDYATKKKIFNQLYL